MRNFACSILLICLLSSVSQAQSPILVRTVPARNSLSGSLTGPVSLTFSQAVAAPENIRVNSNQRQGRRAGTFSGMGTSQIAFQASLPFVSGERVSVTVPASISSPAQVVEFRAAAGRGTATFSSPYTIQPLPGNQPSTVVAGDFDEDGDTDLLVGHTGGTSVCLNNGSGQFALLPTIIPTPTNLRALQVADFNGDGHLDLLSSGRASDARVIVFLGTGQGTFQSQITLLTPSIAAEIATGDFNADGLPDVVIGAQGGLGTLLHFLPGATSGNLPLTTTSQATLSIRDLDAADMDEDGDLDLLLVTDTTLGIYLNDGSGRFTAGKTLTINPFSGSITTGDFNGDGHTDIVCSSYESANLSLVLGTGTGDLQPVQNVVALSRTWHVNSADMDGDADLDVLVTNDRGITQILLNNGQGQFSAASAILLGFEPFNMADAADLNGDGALDIYTSHGVSGPIRHGIDVFLTSPALSRALQPPRRS